MITFICGMIFGGVVSVVVLCALSINKKNDFEGI